MSVDDEISNKKKDIKQEDKFYNRKEFSLTNVEHDIDKKTKTSPKKSLKRSKHTSEIVIEPKRSKKENANSSISDEYEERIQMKKQNSILYQKYLHRGGARNPGSKEVPQVNNILELSNLDIINSNIVEINENITIMYAYMYTHIINVIF